jgi:hypothetical protein
VQRGQIPRGVLRDCRLLQVASALVDHVFFQVP